MRRVTDSALPNGVALADLGGALTWDSASAAVDVIRRGRAELVEHVDDAWLEAHEESLDSLTAWRRLGVQSMLVVPLIVGDRTFGALTFLALDGRPTYSPETQTLAEKFAAHASLALENARLYREAKRATEGRDQVLGEEAARGRRNVAFDIHGTRGAPDSAEYVGGCQFVAARWEE